MSDAQILGDAAAMAAPAPSLLARLAGEAMASVEGAGLPDAVQRLGALYRATPPGQARRVLLALRLEALGRMEGARPTPVRAAPLAPPAQPEPEPLAVVPPPPAEPAPLPKGHLVTLRLEDAARMLLAGGDEADDSPSPPAGPPPLVVNFPSFDDADDAPAAAGPEVTPPAAGKRKGAKPAAGFAKLKVDFPGFDEDAAAEPASPAAGLPKLTVSFPSFGDEAGEEPSPPPAKKGRGKAKAAPAKLAVDFSAFGEDEPATPRLAVDFSAFDGAPVADVGADTLAGPAADAERAPPANKPRGKAKAASGKLAVDFSAFGEDEPAKPRLAVDFSVFDGGALADDSADTPAGPAPDAITPPDAEVTLPGKTAASRRARSGGKAAAGKVSAAFPTAETAAPERPKLVVAFPDFTADDSAAQADAPSKLAITFPPTVEEAEVLHDTPPPARHSRKPAAPKG